jgi:8-oxo-dGTP pyrophosphatase MutT (NUDIX family)
MDYVFKNELKEWISQGICTKKVAQEFLSRVNQGNLTRDENKDTHFCVYFAANDPTLKQVFIGYHIKSGLWLFNGGHIDQGEFPEQALEREIGEEWGISMKSSEIGNPLLLTLTKINDPAKQRCKAHFDIWYFVNLNKVDFKPDREKLAKEFYQTRWMSPMEARKLVTDPNTLFALTMIEKEWK